MYAKTSLKTDSSYYPIPEYCKSLQKVEVETYGGDWVELPFIEVTKRIDGKDILVGFSLYEVFSSDKEQLQLTYE